jgi:hypothetical protein
LWRKNLELGTVGEDFVAELEEHSIGEGWGWKRRDSDEL